MTNFSSCILNWVYKTFTLLSIAQGSLFGLLGDLQQKNWVASDWVLDPLYPMSLFQGHTPSAADWFQLFLIGASLFNSCLSEGLSEMFILPP